MPRPAPSRRKRSSRSSVAVPTGSGEQRPARAQSLAARRARVGLARRGRERRLGQPADGESDVEARILRRRPSAVLDPVRERPQKNDEDEARTELEVDGGGVRAGCFGMDGGGSYGYISLFWFG